MAERAAIPWLGVTTRGPGVTTMLAERDGHG